MQLEFMGGEGEKTPQVKFPLKINHLVSIIYNQCFEILDIKEDSLPSVLPPNGTGHLKYGIFVIPSIHRPQF